MITVEEYQYVFNLLVHHQAYSLTQGVSLQDLLTTGESLSNQSLDSDVIQEILFGGVRRGLFLVGAQAEAEAETGAGAGVLYAINVRALEANPANAVLLPATFQGVFYNVKVQGPLSFRAGNQVKGTFIPLRGPDPTEQEDLWNMSNGYPWNFRGSGLGGAGGGGENNVFATSGSYQS